MERDLGKVTIAPNVLVTIVRKTAVSVPGVAKLCENVPGVKRLLGIPASAEGVALRVVDDKIAVDVYLVARRDVDLLQMGRRLQRDITRAIQEIVGREVREVNIHIEDVAAEPDQDARRKEEASP